MNAQAHPSSLGDMIAIHAARDPRAPAITHGDATIDRGELSAAINRRARLISSTGVSLGDFVIIALSNGIEFFETTFALWKLGASPCPVSPSLPAAELRRIVDLMRPQLIIGRDADESCETLAAGQSTEAFSSAALTSAVSPSWKAITSGGSTGKPKVVVSHQRGERHSNQAGYALQRFEETILNPGPLYHNAAFSAAHHCLFGGGHVVSMERFAPEEALALVEQHRVGHVMMVPTMMGRILRLPEHIRLSYDVSSLKTVIHLAAPCPEHVKQGWIDWLGAERIVEVYAGTEGVGATTISGAEWADHKGSVGRPKNDGEIAILDEEGQPKPRGEVGEIHFFSVEGADPGFHYLGADIVRRGDWISLGDLGYLDEQGYLFLVDRRTDMIVSGGANVYAAEVEAALGKHPDVCASVVIGLPDEDLGARVHAIVQAPSVAGRAPSESALKDFLASQLARYKIPRSFEFVTEELRDDAGKVRRAELRDARLLRPPVGPSSSLAAIPDPEH